MSDHSPSPAPPTPPIPTPTPSPPPPPAVVPPETVNIAPLLHTLTTSPTSVTPSQILTTITAILSGTVNPVQTASFLTALHLTHLDTHPDVIAAGALALRSVGIPIPFPTPPSNPALARGSYRGGLVDIVGTGGDGHNTFNVSTTSSILAAAFLNVAKHGNKASTSASGSADILVAMGADLAGVTPQKVVSHFTEPDAEGGRYVFLYAPTFHPSLGAVAPIRKLLGHRTLFNLLGPLVNPIDYSLEGGLEARIIGVAKYSMGRVFAEALRELGCTKGMVVSGREGLDEVSCQGGSYVWQLVEEGARVEVREYEIHPTVTFGLPVHELTEVAGGKSPEENAVILTKLLNNELPEGDAILDFVLINTATLFVSAGLVDEVEGDKEDWEWEREGVRGGRKWVAALELAREAVRSGRGGRAWGEYVAMSQR
ncbi:anthranilate phosphoribosyltransferase [Ascobolus immersus RN42]|uniref:Anthranilate phosphoribosyltransferase n=1 Tax=Ascobolus immersus RN42 TaxID=1160509 RepID=A0A3N4HK31_ASCIM|nr:anthranilate phosphoribosyltransferase [Ascobolus immersus RN42]